MLEQQKTNTDYSSKVTGVSHSLKEHHVWCLKLIMSCSYIQNTRQRNRQPKYLLRVLRIMKPNIEHFSSFSAFAIWSLIINLTIIRVGGIKRWRGPTWGRSLKQGDDPSVLLEYSHMFLFWDMILKHNEKKLETQGK